MYFLTLPLQDPSPLYSFLRLSCLQASRISTPSRPSVSLPDFHNPSCYSSTSHRLNSFSPSRPLLRNLPSFHHSRPPSPRQPPPSPPYTHTSPSQPSPYFAARTLIPRGAFLDRFVRLLSHLQLSAKWMWTVRGWDVGGRVRAGGEVGVLQRCLIVVMETIK